MAVRCNALLGGALLGEFREQPGSVKDRDDLDGIAVRPVDHAKRSNDVLSEVVLAAFGNDAP